MNLVLNDVISAVAFTGFDEVHPLIKRFKWATNVVRYSNGQEQRNQHMSRPLREWDVNWDILDETTRNKLIEFHTRVRGAYDVFMYSDRDDYTCSLAECSIVAIAAQVEFQLKKRYYYGETEFVDENKTRITPHSASTPVVVEVDSVTKTEGVDFTINDNTGILDFTLMGAPGAGAVITASYNFYFPVRFQDDTLTDKHVYPSVYTYPKLGIIEVIE